MSGPREFSVATGRGSVTARHFLPPPGAGEAGPRASFILAHGAGAGQSHPFITGFARALADLGIDVITFNFDYTEQKRRLPDRAPVLEACYRAVVAAACREVPAAARTLVIGGKSMGGRMATQIAAAPPALPIAGIVLLGYPLHPPGNAAKRRDVHLPAITVPTLFVQGSRDTFGTPDELGPALATMQPPPVLHVVEGGDHGFKVAGAGRSGQAGIDAGIQRTVAGWILDLARAPRSAP